MRYVDGFVLAVSKKKLKDYKKMATDAGKIWKKHGALEYIEAVADDVKKNKWSDITFPMTVKAKPSELVVIAFIVFRSRKHRDQVNAKVMKDPAMDGSQFEGKVMPFDMKRMVYGGFQSIVDL